MSKPIKYGALALVAVMFFIFYIVFDWYRFATAGAIDPRQGVYGNKHLEVWIDINARMPNAMRLWACRMLREREKAALGGQNTIPFHSCQPDFASHAAASSKSEAIVGAIARGASGVAKQRHATDEQNAQIAACVTDALNKAITPEQRASLDGDKPGTDALVALNVAGAAARKGCLAQAGL